MLNNLYICRQRKRQGDVSSIELLILPENPDYSEVVANREGAGSWGGGMTGQDMGRRKRKWWDDATMIVLHLVLIRHVALCWVCICGQPKTDKKKKVERLMKYD